jgi:hypothetical protein
VHVREHAHVLLRAVLQLRHEVTMKAKTRGSSSEFRETWSEEFFKNVSVRWIAQRSQRQICDRFCSIQPVLATNTTHEKSEPQYAQSAQTHSSESGRIMPVLVSHLFSCP